MDFLIGTLTRMGGAGIGRVRLENDRLRLLWTNGSLTDPNWQSLGPNGQQRHAGANARLRKRA